MRTDNLRAIFNYSSRVLRRVKFVVPCVAIVGAIAHVNYVLPTSWIVVSSLVIIAVAMVRTDPEIVAEIPDVVEAKPASGSFLEMAKPELQNLVACLPDPCFLLQPGGEIIFQNAPAKQALGVMKYRASIFSLLRAAEVRGAVEDTAATGNPNHVQYFERVPNDRLLEVHVASLLDRDGANAGGKRPIIMVLRDLTQQYRLDRMRTDFIANASHELRTPLASLIGFIETLKGPAREDIAARDKFLDIMGDQAGRMSRLIDDLLSLSRLEMDANIQPSETVSLSEVASHVLDTLRPIAQARDVEFRFESSADRHLVLGFRDDLVQAAQNLVENAIKYGQDGKHVDISLSRESSQPLPDLIKLNVRDFGPGIEPEYIPRLTERFYRVDAASSREKGGTGLGLAIVKHILNRHKGNLKIDSKPGHGSTFTIALNAVPPEPKSDN